MALVAVAAGVALFLWTVRELGWRRSLGIAVDPEHAEKPRLVLAGPFAVVRHPITLAAILVSLGWALHRRMAGAWLVTVGLAAVLVLLARRSETFLMTRFGEAYSRYRRAVPFLLPAFGRIGAGRIRRASGDLDGDRGDA